MSITETERQPLSLVELNEEYQQMCDRFLDRVRMIRAIIEGGDIIGQWEYLLKPFEEIEPSLERAVHLIATWQGYPSPTEKYSPSEVTRWCIFGRLIEGHLEQTLTKNDFDQSKGLHIVEFAQALKETIEVVDTYLTLGDLLTLFDDPEKTPVCEADLLMLIARALEEKTEPLMSLISLGLEDPDSTPGEKSTKLALVPKASGFLPPASTAPNNPDRLFTQVGESAHQAGGEIWILLLQKIKSLHETAQRITSVESKKMQETFEQEGLT